MKHDIARLQDRISEGKKNIWRQELLLETLTAQILTNVAAIEESKKLRGQQRSENSISKKHFSTAPAS